MRWRRTIVYLTVVTVLAGYFYYFEVVRRDREQRREMAARQVFHFDPAKVSLVKITRRDAEVVELMKKDQWIITAPMRTEADETAVTGLLNALSALEVKKLIADSPRDPAPFGLDRGRLTIDFRDDRGHGYRLIVGAKNPVGDARYAKVAGSDRIFLISAGDYEILDQGLHDLRRRALFSFDDAAVRQLRVRWANGTSLRIVRQAGGGSNWSAPARADVVIGSDKVANVLDQLRWLRALSFLDQGTNQLRRYGLDKPRVVVSITLKGRKVNLQVGKAVNKGAVTALCSTLAGVITVQSDFLQDLPKDWRDLEDRSLFKVKPETIRRIVWRLGLDRGEYRRTSGDHWSYRDKDGKFKPLENPWRIQALFWELQDIEYHDRLVPAPPRPVDPRGLVRFYDDKRAIASLSWSGVPDGVKGTRLPVWITGHRSLVVDLAAKALARIEKRLEEIRSQENTANLDRVDG